MADIKCPHCGMWIPVSGSGAKTIVKMPGVAKTKLKDDKPKEGLKDILGEHWDNYWTLAKLFGPNKNFTPTTSARLYIEALRICGHEQIYKQAIRVTRLTEQKFLPQLSKWLEGQGYMQPEMEREPQSEPTTNRLDARVRAK